uniref:Uncharacterized protein n=1 Tax=Clastoptera arizonana TaxID=38151 RepID=A0A1B6C971_9HEMI
MSKKEEGGTLREKATLNYKWINTNFQFENNEVPIKPRITWYHPDDDIDYDCRNHPFYPFCGCCCRSCIKGLEEPHRPQNFRICQTLEKIEPTYVVEDSKIGPTYVVGDSNSYVREILDNVIQFFLSKRT